MWFRQDLRLHDNESLQEALNTAREVIPVYIFDERLFRGTTNYGFKKVGKFRTQFIIESIHDLRNSLRELNSDLIVRVGKPEEVLYDIAHKAKASWVFCNRERTPHEVTVQDSLEKNLWSIGQELRFARGKMLYYTADLPFPITHTPDTFTQFRKEVERYVNIRKPIPAPEEKFNPLTAAIDAGEVPKLQDFEMEPFEKDTKAGFTFVGGENAGLDRLRSYFWGNDAAANFKENRNDLFGENFSSKFSAYLSQGCLSPKMIYQELKRFEEERLKNKATYSLFQKLLWRDFFRLMAKKHGEKIFQIGGTRGAKDVNWDEDFEKFQAWKEGKTGIPFVDANMREINRTGYMSGKGRQTVASYLVHDLNINWQMGADYFESLLIDYDLASNYGNWNYIAGVGSDMKEERSVNVISQAKRLDPDAEYIKLWIPELEDVPADDVFQPEVVESNYFIRDNGSSRYLSEDGQQSYQRSSK